jgi:hypothetical protein
MISALLTLLMSLVLAGVTGWFSVVGIMSIYAGATMHSALIMGAVIECAKLVGISWLYRNWNYASWQLKLPFLYFIPALMLITSIGVFGFLSKAHLEQGASTINNSAKVVQLDQQIAREKAIIVDNESVTKQLDTTINSYLGKDQTNRSLLVRKQQAPQRKQLQADIATSNATIDQINEEKFKLESETRKLDLDVGPIKYVAEIVFGENGKVSTAIKIFTLLIVSTLDPFAIMLLIAANSSLLRLKNEEEATVSTIKDALENDEKGKSIKHPILYKKEEPVLITEPDEVERDWSIDEDEIRETYGEAGRILAEHDNTDGVEIALSAAENESKIHKALPNPLLEYAQTENARYTIATGLLDNTEYNFKDLAEQVEFSTRPYYSSLQIREPRPTTTDKDHNSVVQEDIIHFLPIKINEEEEIKNVEFGGSANFYNKLHSQATHHVTPKDEKEMQDHNEDEFRGISAQMVEEVSKDSVAKTDTPIIENNTTTDNQPIVSIKSYPKVLGWINAFNKD